MAPTLQTWLSLFQLYLGLGILTAIIVFSLLLTSFVKRKKGSNGHTNTGSESGLVPLLTVVLTAIVLFGLAFGTFNAIGYMTTPPRDDRALTIKVTAFQWGWNFTYPSGFSSVNLLYVPVNRTIILNVSSRDVFHSLGIPDMKVKTDAIPGRWNTLWFVSPNTGNYTIRCYELCGVGHTFMTAKLVVMSQADFDNWYRSKGGS